MSVLGSCYHLFNLRELAIMNNKKIDLNNFDFKPFQVEAISRLQPGESLTGKDRILEPLIKKIL